MMKSGPLVEMLVEKPKIKVGLIAIAGRGAYHGRSWAV
jgi:hypothetical protein